MGCFTFNWRKKTGEHKDRNELFHKILNKWTDEGSPLSNVFNNNPSMFKKMYENVTGVDFDYGELPSLPKLRLFEKKTKQFNSKIIKDPNVFAKWFYLPEEILNKNPHTKQAMDSFLTHHNEYRGDMQKYSRQMNDIVSELNNAMQLSSLNEKGWSFNQARKELLKREAKFREYMKAEEWDEAYSYYQKNLASLTKRGELAIFKQAEKLFRNPDALKDPEIHQKYGAGIVQAAKSWHKMRVVLQNDLQNTFGTYVDILKAHQTGGNDLSGLVKSMEKLQNIIGDKGFMPHQAMDIFPTVHKINEAINRNIGGKELTDLSRFTENLTETILNKIKPGTELFRANLKKAPGFYSQDLVGIIDGYTKGVTRFVYQTKMTKAYLNGINKLGSMDSPTMEGHAQFLMNYLRDTHSAALGMHQQNSKLQKAARVITSFEFISKLGFNMRGALRNSTQSLQNFVYFGGKAVRDANRIIESRDFLKDDIDAEMKRHGLFFAEIEEMAGGRHMQGDIKFDEATGTYYEDVGSISHKFIKGMEKVAQFSSENSILGVKKFSMQGVENMNRAWTFKIAYSMKWNELNKRNDMLRKRIQNDPGNFEGKDIESKIYNEIRKKSSAFAAEMTKEIHFEYAGFAKPKAIRTPLGSVLGQFTTYSINFFNYQRKIARDGFDATLARDWENPNIRRTAYLGLQYYLINGILASFFNLDFGNIVQNDTAQRVEQLITWLDPSSTDEDKKKTFFGKGPVLGTVGGPFVSDMVTLGQVAGLLSMDEGDFMSYVAGYTDQDSQRDTDATKEILRILNTSLYRIVYQHKQNLTDGASAITVLGNELGLYSTKETRRGRAAWNDYLGQQPTKVKKQNIDLMNSVFPGKIGGQIQKPSSLGGQLTNKGGQLSQKDSGVDQNSLMRLLEAMKG